MIMSYQMFSVAAMALAVLSGGAAAFPVANSEDNPHAAHMLKCAAMCADCQVQCDACFHHCASLVTEGKKEHAISMNCCVDCADCCNLCATLCARQSAMSAHALECCVKCCEQCAAACEKFPEDKQMAACAKSCRNCAKECAAMVKMAK